MSRPRLHVLTGCTAVGKTARAIAWARRHDAEIISCDSLLAYRGMDIGTAKPTADERAAVPHHLIDVNELGERMDVRRYLELARGAIDAIAQRGRRVLVVGGSGFYLKAFFSPVADDVAVPPAIREQVAALDREAAVTELRQRNPAGLAGLDLANPRRVARALERCLASGRTLAELAADFARLPVPFSEWEKCLTRLELPAAELDRRIEERTQRMLAEGLVAEVRSLREQGLEANPSAARAIGYREVLEFLDGRRAESELPAAIIRNTRSLVRKQRTWFRTQLPEARVQRPDDPELDGLFGDPV